MDDDEIPLQYAFAKRYPFQNQHYAVAEDAGLDTFLIDFTGRSVVVWFNIIKQAKLQNKLVDLVNRGLKDFPETPEFLAFKNNTKISEGPQPVAAEGSLAVGNNFEKLTGKQSTLLPISFLEEGLSKANSVCRVEVVSRNEVGTGFLLEGDILLTNNHVLDSLETARTSIIQFNYQDNASGNERGVTEFSLDPDAFFKTSPKETFDFTLVKVKDNLKGSANSQFHFLKLNPTTINKDDFVNIIQHPAGQKKQIALYHNLVTYVDDRIVQYLTDTLPGSSGSPVFNTKWEVVALHHSGRYLQNSEPNGPRAINEGININRVIEALT